LRDEKVDILVFPDEGAHKRYNMDEQFVSFYGKKIRNWETREITGYKLSTDTDKDLNYITGKTVLIIDDIIATGGTIYKTVQELKKYGVGKIFVYCSHCENQIMTGKLRPLLDSGDIEKIYTTGSIYSDNHPRIQTIGIKRDNEETEGNN
jgi:ribose-phosphate pyrophosphokinase